MTVAVPAAVIFFFLILTAEKYVEDTFLQTKLEPQHQANREVGGAVIQSHSSVDKLRAGKNLITELKLEGRSKGNYIFLLTCFCKMCLEIR